MLQESLSPLLAAAGITGVISFQIQHSSRKFSNRFAKSHNEVAGAIEKINAAYNSMTQRINALTQANENVTNYMLKESERRDNEFEAFEDKYTRIIEELQQRQSATELVLQRNNID